MDLMVTHNAITKATFAVNAAKAGMFFPPTTKIAICTWVQFLGFPKFFVMLEN
jgi:hypothetical protein